MSKESIDRIKNETVSKNHPFKSGDVTIDILHVDVHPTREASITWKYSDGTSETITIQGNGGTRFKDKSGKWTDWLNFGDHTEKLVQHMSLQKQYKFEKLNRQPGRNTWMLQTKSGGVTTVEISNPIENWGGLITIDLNWTAGTGLAKGPSKVPIKPAPRPCCKAMTAGCMACAAGLSVEEYCNRNPGRVGCPSKKITVDAFCAKSQNSTYCTSHTPEPYVAPGPTPPGDVLPDPAETEEEDDVEEVVIEKVDTEEEGIPMPSTNAMIAAAVLMGGILALSR
jgi:hypothetical protein